VGQLRLYHLSLRHCPHLKGHLLGLGLQLLSWYLLRGQRLRLGLQLLSWYLLRGQRLLSWGCQWHLHLHMWCLAILLRQALSMLRLCHLGLLKSHAWLLLLHHLRQRPLWLRLQRWLRSGSYAICNKAWTWSS